MSRFVYRDDVFGWGVVLKLVGRREGVSASRHHYVEDFVSVVHRVLNTAVCHRSGCGDTAVKGQVIPIRALQMLRGLVPGFGLKGVDDVYAHLDEVVEGPAAGAAGVNDNGQVEGFGQIDELLVNRAEATAVEVKADEWTDLRARSSPIQNRSMRPLAASRDRR